MQDLRIEITKQERDILKLSLLAKSEKFKGNLKQWEIKLQEIIENVFNDKCWWEITNCDIFIKLLETSEHPNCIGETIDAIINGCKIKEQQ